MNQFLIALLLTLPILASVPKNQSSGFNNEEKRKKVTQAILDNLVKEKYEDARSDFHVSLKAVLPVEKISENWRAIIQLNGKFQKVLSVNAITTMGYNQVQLRCEFANDNMTLEATFNEDDKVIGLYFKP